MIVTDPSIDGDPPLILTEQDQVDIIAFLKLLAVSSRAVLVGWTKAKAVRMTMHSEEQQENWPRRNGNSSILLSSWYPRPCGSAVTRHGKRDRKQALELAGSVSGVRTVGDDICILEVDPCCFSQACPGRRVWVPMRTQPPPAGEAPNSTLSLRRWV